MKKTSKGKIELVGPPDPSLRTSPILRAKASAADNSCLYNGKQYSTGALLCMEGELFQCSYGTWVDQGKTCGSG